MAKKPVREASGSDRATRLNAHSSFRQELWSLSMIHRVRTLPDVSQTPKNSHGGMPGGGGRNRLCGQDGGHTWTMSNSHLWGLCDLSGPHLTLKGYSDEQDKNLVPRSSSLGPHSWEQGVLVAMPPALLCAS